MAILAYRVDDDSAIGESCTSGLLGVGTYGGTRGGARLGGGTEW